jgi:hypothetical protein
MIGAPLRLRLIRKVAALARVLPTLDLRVVRTTSCCGSGTVHCLIVQAELLKLKKSGQFPEESVLSNLVSGSLIK